MMKRRILVTGAGGFLGGFVLSRLVELGHYVVALDTSPPARTTEGIDGDVTWITGDVTSIQCVESCLRCHQIDDIVHLAAALTVECSREPSKGTFANCVGTATVFEAAQRLGVGRVVFASSVAARGSLSGSMTVYGATKAFCELLSLAFQRTGPEYVGLRFGWIYGPGRIRGWNDLYDVIMGFAVERKEVVCPDVREPIDWLYVTDAADAVVACINSRRLLNRIYDVAGDCRTVRDAVRYLQARFP